jgi:hypothetical protein
LSGHRFRLRVRRAHAFAERHELRVFFGRRHFAVFRI